VQFAVKNGVVYVLEVNPRASRTVPFVSKTVGVPLAAIAARLMLGESLDDVGLHEEIIPPYVAVKEAVFPFNKFREFDPLLGPEMRSTGEVMGIADSFGSAFAKAQLSADNGLPQGGAIFITVNDHDKPTVTPIARRFHEMGFQLYATEGTARFLQHRGIPTLRVLKVHEGRPNGIDLAVNGALQLLINTPLGKHAQRDDYTLRQAAIAHHVPYTTTLSAASAACDAILALRSRLPSVRSLQEWHQLLGVEPALAARVGA
jgi:carbamoyl-phosphate synthase large subunit